MAKPDAARQKEMDDIQEEIRKMLAKTEPGVVKKPLPKQEGVPQA